MNKAYEPKFNYILNDLALSNLIIRNLYSKDVTYDDKRELENQIELIQQENQELKEKLDKYENPEDMTLMMMWCTEKVKDENEKLKKQLENKYEKVGTLTSEILYEENTKLVNQQKEFIKKLEDEIQQQETVIAENQEKLYFFKYEDEKEDLKLSSQKAYIRRIILEEVLQKYRSIIGDDK